MPAIIAMIPISTALLMQYLLNEILDIIAEVLILVNSSIMELNKKVAAIGFEPTTQEKVKRNVV